MSVSVSHKRGALSRADILRLHYNLILFITLGNQYFITNLMIYENSTEKNYFPHLFSHFLICEQTLFLFPIYKLQNTTMYQENQLDVSDQKDSKAQRTVITLRLQNVKTHNMCFIGRAISSTVEPQILNYFPRATINYK